MGILQELRERGTAQGYQELIDRIPYARFLGITVEERADGQYLTRLAFADKLVGNPNLPALHGGVIGAFLEITAILQLVWESDIDALPKPVNLTIDYLRSAGPKDTWARGTMTKHGRRVANVRVEAWQESPERPVAAAHGHFLLPRPA